MTVAHINLHLNQSDKFIMNPGASSFKYFLRFSRLYPDYVSTLKFCLWLGNKAICCFFILLQSTWKIFSREDDHIMYNEYVNQLHSNSVCKPGMHPGERHSRWTLGTYEPVANLYVEANVRYSKCYRHIRKLISLGHYYGYCHPNGRMFTTHIAPLGYPIFALPQMDCLACYSFLCLPASRVFKLKNKQIGQLDRCWC